MPYSTADDLYKEFGKDNVWVWADLNNEHDEVIILDRISRKIEEADSEIDARLRQKAYDVPFTTTPVLVRQMSALRAGTLLYLGRGITDNNPENHETKVQEDRYEQLMQDILSGKLILETGTRARSELATDVDSSESEGVVTLDEYRY